MECTLPQTQEALVRRLQQLRHERRVRHKVARQVSRERQRLTPAEREVVLQKTDGHCHICGGGITGYWQADHVLAHSAGGQHRVDNYLPAHKLCNGYRWDYDAE